MLPRLPAMDRVAEWINVSTTAHFILPIQRLQMLFLLLLQLLSTLDWARSTLSSEVHPLPFRISSSERAVLHVAAGY